MDLRPLRTFVAVAELRHFARAAGLCNLSQPAVSHQIAQLETEIGAPLLNRAGRRVSLTVAGEVLLEEARRILAAVDRARERLQEVTQGAVGRIRLGATATPGLYVLPPLLADYQSKHAGYELRLEIGPIHTLTEKVARNDLDMAVIAGARSSGELRAQPLVRDDFLLVVHPAKCPPGRHRIKPAQFARDCWIVREEGSDTRRQLVAWWHRHRLAPSRTMTFEGPDAVKRAAMAGLGVALVSRLTVGEELAAGRLAALTVSGPLPSREICVVDHPQKHHGAACRAMLELFADTWPTCQPRPTSSTRLRR
jgi:DNA-binding transcriptional LysR family regulator